MEAPAARGKGTPATIPATKAAGRMQCLLGWCWAPLGPMREASGSIARVEGRFTGGAAMLLRFHKPYGVLSQFTDGDSRTTLKTYLPQPHIYAAGRLDRDSEGLLLLTNHGGLQHWISHPRYKVEKGYWALLDQTPDAATLKRLHYGVALKDGPARALQAMLCPAPQLPERDPAPRIKSSSNPCWLDLTIDEGRNRLVRRLCAAVGTPVLRLIRYRIGAYVLEGLAPGAYAEAPLPTAFRGPLPQKPPPRRPGRSGPTARPRSKSSHRPGSQASKTPPRS